MQESLELTILIPCLNESLTIGACIKRAKYLLKTYNIKGEILVSDNGSTDGSQEIAKELGAIVVSCPTRGYGAALMYGIHHAKGKYIIMADADDSYHFDEYYPMIEKLREGYDVCMGSRFKGRIMPKAMPFLNRYLGNPVLTAIGKVLFGISVTDFHCGARAFRRDAILSLNLITTGMEWASEMIIKAKLAGLKITEVPVNLYKDGRNRPPHLRRWRDGWRHLRFMFLHSPEWLFMLPGCFMAVAGFLGMLILIINDYKIFDIHFNVYHLMAFGFLTIIGNQIFFTGLFAKLYSYITGLIPYPITFPDTIKRFTLEKLLIFSLIIGFVGILLSFNYLWYPTEFTYIYLIGETEKFILGTSLVAISIQCLFNGFMLSVLFLKKTTNGVLINEKT